MKHFLSKEMRGQTLSHILVLAAGVAMVTVVFRFSAILGFIRSLLSLLTPFLLGYVMAYLLMPIHKRLCSLLQKIPVFRSRRGARISSTITAILCVVLLVLAVITFLIITVPQLATSIQSIVSYISSFITANEGAINELLVKYEFLTVDGEQIKIAWDNIASQLLGYSSLLLGYAGQIASGMYNSIYSFLVGVIAAFYLLLERDVFCSQTKKLCYSILSRTACERLIRWTRRANQIFAGFIRGKILDSLIIGVICYFCMLLFRIEYPLFISVIVGVTNIIPFFGPFIGAIPSALILLIVNPMSALWFLVFILILQQIDGNIIGPRILGSYVGISPFWTMVSIIVGSGLFGFAGMLLSVPVFALIYAICKSVAEDRLRVRELPTETAAYTAAPEQFMDADSRPMPPREVQTSMFRIKRKEKGENK